MEEAEVRDVSGGSSSRGGRAAVATLAAVFACALVSALIGAGARAQVPPVYEEPTPSPTASPTPTPTPTGTPFQDQPQAQPQLPARPSRLNPFPRVRAAGTYTDTRTTFTRVTVRAPKGARVEARCTPRRCTSVKRTFRSTRTERLKALQRSFPPRTTIEIRVSSPTKVGKYVRIRTIRGAPPQRRDRCLRPGSAKPAACEGL